MKLKNFLEIVGIGTAISGIKYGIEKFTNKNAEPNEESQDEVYEADDEIYEKVKIDRKKYCDNVKNNSFFLKKLYSGLRFNPRFDIDLFNVIDAYESDFTIAVKPGDEPGTTEIQCRLTDVNRTSKNDPKVPDYIRCLKTSVNEVSKTWKFELINRQALFLYFKYTDLKTGNDIEVKMPKNLFENWASEKHDGTVEFFADFSNGDSEAKAVIADWLSEMGMDLNDVSDTYLFMTYSIIMSNYAGIIPMVDLIEKLVNTDIIRGRDGNVYRYEYLLVNAPNKEGVVDFNNFYDVKDDKVIILNLDEE